MNERDTGMGTTPSMWKMISELAEGKELPESLNEALLALCKGEAMVMPDDDIRALLEGC